ncbi:c-type lectin domain-containing protein [Caerostris darwini]|uniref:C-type lectin domain-containing protein n=1 Tax=Caerostris darwini TaxID=1538125 RepID=A0AAV4PS55_9ARAC|nr:c-type lectin domain-containing protein [Caerostris darwini]
MKKGNILQAWIGVRKRDGIFYYDNGALLQHNNTMWGPDQPNDSGGTQQCVQMMSEMEYLWNDFDCARPVGFVCQYVWGRVLFFSPESTVFRDLKGRWHCGRLTKNRNPVPPIRRVSDLLSPDAKRTGRDSEGWELLPKHGHVASAAVVK